MRPRDLDGMMIGISCFWWWVFAGFNVSSVTVHALLIPDYQRSPALSLQQQYPTLRSITQLYAEVGSGKEGRKGVGGCSSRRNILTTSLLAATAMSSGVTTKVNPAYGHGLVQFPCPNGTLKNSYHFMRAGESLLESENVWGTNPMFLTNRVENQLSPKGHQQVTAACDKMRPHNLAISQVKFPLAANAMDTAQHVKQQLLIPGNVVVPEYTYLDQRGIGSWDMMPLDQIQNAIWALDDLEAGYDGRGGLPPQNTDGTPNETLYNQVTRLRQLLSITETYNSGDTILFIFPDGTGPALLSCLIAGIPLNRVHELQFNPGEVRMDITYDSVRATLPAQPTTEYLDAVQAGKVELQRLRSMSNPSTTVGNADFAPETTISPTNRQQQYEAAKRKRAKEQEESDIRRQKQQQQTKKDTTQRRKAIAENDDNRENPNVERAKQALLSLISLGFGAGFVSTSMSSTKEPKGEHPQQEAIITSDRVDQGNSVVAGAAGGETGQGEIKVEESKLPVSATQFHELEVLEDLVETVGFDIPEFGLLSHEEEGYVKNDLENIRQEKQLMIQKAEKAMDEYLNQDNGASEYDSWMSQLLVEDDA